MHPCSAQLCQTVYWGHLGKIWNYMGQEIEVDILVGLDAYWKLMTPEIVVMSDGLVAQRSVFGWILSGPLPVPTVAARVSPISYFARIYPNLIDQLLELVKIIYDKDPGWSWSSVEWIQQTGTLLWEHVWGVASMQVPHSRVIGIVGKHVCGWLAIWMWWWCGWLCHPCVTKRVYLTPWDLFRPSSW